MSGGGGGGIIIGDKPLVVELEQNKHLVADFRLARMEAILSKYHADESSVTADEQQFLFRCAADIVDHP